MPDGATHFMHWKIGWLGIPAVSTASWILSSQLNLVSTCVGPACIPAHLIIAIGVPAGYALGSFVDPDMDIIGMTKAEGRLMRLGVLGGLLVAYWTFYGYLFRRMHRSRWTHGPVLSTAIRYVYQFWALFIWIYNTPKDMAWLIFLLIGMFIGTTVSDTIHYLADKRSGELRR